MPHNHAMLQCQNRLTRIMASANMLRSNQSRVRFPPLSPAANCIVTALNVPLTNFFIFCIRMMLLVRGASRLSPTHGDFQHK